MAESMIERVAAAIAMKSEGWTKNAKDYIPHARAAIEAMRAVPEHLAADLRLEGQHIAAYHDIIDAALNEQVSG